MKTCFVFLCVILAVFAVVRADDCKIDGRSLKIGETYSQPGTCKQIKCTGINSFSSKTCAEVHSLKPCKYHPQDNSKLYPACCPYFEC